MAQNEPKIIFQREARSAKREAGQRARRQQQGLDAQGFPLFGTGAYCLFTFYLLWCVMKGNMRVGLRCFCFAIHPMK